MYPGKKEGFIIEQHYSTIIFSLFWLALLWGALSIILWTFRNGISPMPTSLKVKKALLENLPESVEGKVYELGAGFGTLLFPLGERYENIVGFETSPIPFYFMKARSLFIKKHVELKKSDFYQQDLSDAGLIVCYLYPGAMSKLKNKFEFELKKGCFVVSNTFAIPGWKPKKVIQIKDIYRTKVYLYQI